MFSKAEFIRLFGGAPPGYDRPDFAREALTAFWAEEVPDHRDGVTEVFMRFQDPRDLPYGALACIEYGYRLRWLDESDTKRRVRSKGWVCFQPLRNEGSRFTSLEMVEFQNKSPRDARFERDANAILQSLRLP